MKRIIFFFVVLIITGITVWGQNPTYYLNPDKNLNQYSIDQWTTDNGLITNSLLHIYQSKDGYLWISSYSGLIRFNGIEFKLYDTNNTAAFSSNVIRNMTGDSNGNLWLTTHGSGLVHFANGEFKSYGAELGMDNLYLGILVDDKDRVWAASPEVGWFYFDNGEITVIDSSSLLKNVEVRSIVQSRNGAIWFSTLGEGIFKYEKGKLTSYTTSDGLIDNWVSTLFVDEKDNLWIGTSSGICYFDGERFSKRINSINENVNHISADKYGDMWIATINGLYRKKAFDDNQQIEFIDSKNGLPGNFIIDFLFDSEGNLWITHYKAGLSCIKDGKFTNYTNESGLPGRVVNTIAEKNDSVVWVGFDNGAVASISKNKISEVKIKHAISDKRVRHILFDALGRAWISTYSGLLQIDSNGNEKWMTLGTNINNVKVRLTFEDTRGNIWVGTRNKGLFKITKNNKVTNYTVNEGLSSNLIMAIEEDANGNIWVGTSEGVDALNVIKNNGQIITFSEKDGFLCNVVFNISFDDDNRVWIASTSGLWAFVDSSFCCIDTDNGLFNSAVYDFVEDASGYCWMPSANGIMKVEKQQLLDVVNSVTNKVKCHVYNKHDGLSSSECNSTAQVTKGENGNLYFPTVNGLSVINPQRELVNNYIPSVLIEDIIVDENNYSGQSIVKEPLSAKTKRITINYVALSFYEPNEISYEYKLEGFDDDWIRTSNRTVSYTNLGAGEYVFKVRASNNDGIWNTKGSSFLFKIKRRFVDTFLFYTIIIVSVIFIVVLLYNWRLSQIRVRQQYLEKVVAERTKEVTKKNNELEQQKTEIKNQNEILQQQKTEIEKQASELIAQQKELSNSNQLKDKIFSIISHDLRSPLGNVQNMLNLLLDKNNQLGEEKKTRILGNLAEMTKSTFYLLDNLLNWSRFERGVINYDPQMFLIAPVVNEVFEILEPISSKKQIKLVSRIEESNIAFGDVNMVKTIFRNFIENAVKFTHPSGVVEVYALVRNDMVEFAVRDSGIGLSDDAIHNLMNNRIVDTTFGTLNEKGSGLGLMICKDFIKRNGGEFHIESSVGEGSTFFFTLKRFQI